VLVHPERFVSADPDATIQLGAHILAAGYNNLDTDYGREVRSRIRFCRRRVCVLEPDAVKELVEEARGIGLRAEGLDDLAGSEIDVVAGVPARTFDQLVESDYLFVDEMVLEALSDVSPEDAVVFVGGCQSRRRRRAGRRRPARSRLQRARVPDDHAAADGRRPGVDRHLAGKPRPSPPRRSTEPGASIRTASPVLARPGDGLAFPRPWQRARAARPAKARRSSI